MGLYLFFELFIIYEFYYFFNKVYNKGVRLKLIKKVY